MKIAIFSLLLVVVLLLGLVLLFRYQLQNHRQPLPIHRVFPVADSVRNAMIIFAHPDDEIAVAGVLAQMKQSGWRVAGIYLTAGEAGKTGGLVPASQLAATRKEELQAAAKILGLQSVEVLDFPDGKLQVVPPDTVKKVLLEAIERHCPQLIISFDDRVGLYGHPDHVYTGRIVLELCQQYADTAHFPVQQLYCPTLTDGMIALARRISQTFRKNYPKEVGRGLPPPNFGVCISPQGKDKWRAIRAHRTQKHVFDDVFPLHDRISPQLYFQLFAEEYYALLWKR
ncbi:MAG: PIG-L family deacetylase [Cytophagales bacterium]|nr:PIG-L family deacetylase [Bernardetiaceae bacterium]MDW8206166.1 PIG-L family deacetylase [Cytophagales bacterium]